MQTLNQQQQLPACETMPVLRRDDRQKLLQNRSRDYKKAYKNMVLVR
ncbi:hypothetical protein [Brunnivagina elsteri]|nr:hypothetical protein [Calothrix elsteri]